MDRLLVGAWSLRFLDTFILITPFYVVMFAEHGLTPTEIAFALAAWSGTALLLEAPLGVLADRMDRRLLLALAQLIRAVGFAVWMVWPTFWGFLIGLVLWGVKSATLSGAFEALVFDDLKRRGQEPDYVRIFGRTQAARFAGVLAASLGAAALPGLSYGDLSGWSAAAGLAAAASAFILPRAPVLARRDRPAFLAHLVTGAREAASLPGVPGLLVFIAGMQAIVTGMADYWQFFALEVGLPRSGIALFMAALYGVGAVTAMLAHRARGLSQMTLALLFALAGLSVVASAAVYQPWAIVLPMIYVALYWTAEVNADARFQHKLNPETRATVGSIKGFVMQAATLVLMLLFGLAAQVASYRWAFAAGGALAAAWGLSHAARGLRRPRNA
ncbi:MAG: MFS transporter [Phenylobacterium sp.]